MDPDQHRVQCDSRCLFLQKVVALSAPEPAGLSFVLCFYSLFCFVLFCCIYSLRFLLCCKNNFNLLDSAELNWPDLQTSCQTWQAHDFVSCLAHETNEWTSFSLVEQKHSVLCRGHWFSAGGGQELRGQALLVDEGRNEWRNRPVLSPFGSGEHHVLTQRLNVWILCIPLNASHTVRKLKIAGWMKRFEASGLCERGTLVLLCASLLKV